MQTQRFGIRVGPGVVPDSSRGVHVADFSESAEARTRDLGSGISGHECARGCGETSHELTLTGREQRVPEIEDQHDAQLVAVVACFVLDRVVEDQRLADAPLPPVEAYAVAATFGNDERQVRDDARVRLGNSSSSSE